MISFDITNCTLYSLGQKKKKKKKHLIFLRSIQNQTIKLRGIFQIKKLKKKKKIPNPFCSVFQLGSFPTVLSGHAKGNTPFFYPYTVL